MRTSFDWNLYITRNRLSDQAHVLKDPCALEKAAHIHDENARSMARSAFEREKKQVQASIDCHFVNFDDLPSGHCILTASRPVHYITIGKTFLQWGKGDRLTECWLSISNNRAQIAGVSCQAVPHFCFHLLHSFHVSTFDPSRRRWPWNSYSSESPQLPAKWSLR